MFEIHALRFSKTLKGQRHPSVRNSTDFIRQALMCECYFPVIHCSFIFNGQFSRFEDLSMFV